MQELPEEFYEAVRKAVHEHRSDTKAAKECAIAKVKKLSCYQSCVDILVRRGVCEAVDSIRHTETVATKRAAGFYGGPAKVHRGEATDGVYRSLYDNYYIDGSVIGDIRGKDIPRLRASQAAIVNGGKVNLAMLDWFESQGVKDEHRVRDVIPEKKSWAALHKFQNNKPRDG